jgi:hypothetical protein
MTLSAYFAAPAEHQQLAWMNDTILEVLVDSAVSDGQVLIMRSVAARGTRFPSMSTRARTKSSCSLTAR